MQMQYRFVVNFGTLRILYLYFMVTKKIGEQVRSNLCYLICLRHLIRLRGVTNRFFFSVKDLFSFMHASACSELKFNTSTMSSTIKVDFFSCCYRLETILFCWLILQDFLTSELQAEGR